MKITAIKTRLIKAFDCSLEDIITESIESINENSVIAITSKVISLCEGNVLALEGNSKDTLIKAEADSFIPKEESKYGVYITIKDGFLTPSAGVDESNTNGYFVMWPKNPQKSVNRIWRFLKNQYKLQNVGVIITDSTTNPLRLGVTGRAIAHCGFKSLNSKIGEKDLFNKTLRQTRIDVANGLAASAVICMGESDEQTPIAVIEDIPFVEFQNHEPTPEELAWLKIDITDDLYEPLINRAPWIHNKK
ncbi:MAG: putative folate metabolism gamma-glutamate ligase [Clostridiaceae bacterium]|jgi:putative folate metabolism gamma-glutamate ligase|nr:putative folate metabolism gamma-glutamate ligase [Clostridiaceae bacterium]